MMPYPEALAVPLVETMHGRQVADPFRWLEDAESPATTEWLAAQEQLTDGYFSALPVDHWRARLGELAAYERVSPPFPCGERVFFTRMGAEDDMPRLRLRDADGTDRDVLDLAPGQVLDRWDPSPDGRLLAYQVSLRGDERSVLRVLDVDTGAVVDGPIDRVRYSSIAWLPDGSGFYYVRGADDRRVLFHRIGADPDADPVVFGQDFPPRTGFQVTAHAGRWLTVHTRQGLAPGNRIWLADLSTPQFRPMDVGSDEAIHAVRITEDGTAYLLTTEGAPRGRLLVAKVDTGLWRELVPEDPKAVLEAIAATDTELLVLHARSGVHELTAHDRATGKPLRRVRLPGAGRVTGITERPDRAGLWLEYTDHCTPDRVYRYRTGDGRVLSSGVAPKRAVPTRHVTYHSLDGTAVRMLLIGAGDGSRPRPTLITGYGGFGISVRPAYDPSVLAWVEAGGLIAIPAVRGGGEEGADWHHAGRGPAKQRGFDDFTAAARWLIDQGWTTADRLGAFGASNGGLLVGAAVTQHPELYRAAVCIAPLLDMVRYESFGLGASWRQEYGSVAEPAELDWLLSYSPYHHVRRADYPAMLFQVYGNDTRVDPLHARKMCARLQHANPAGMPVLFQNLPDMGHGPRARSQAVSAAATMLAFLAYETGLGLAEEPDQAVP
ncbi:prolyl oligopeptidase family protein [Amycolatopsis sp. cg5]|uniref:prolyl oligopeptidase family serine peptidase n=1 Tax=Amycolatopsis sp. cg5 TaxID=3238802 RepID=UPI003524E823